jgi:hypothetical protein
MSTCPIRLLVAPHKMYMMDDQRSSLQVLPATAMQEETPVEVFEKCLGGPWYKLLRLKAANKLLELAPTRVS